VQTTERVPGHALSASHGHVVAWLDLTVVSDFVGRAIVIILIVKAYSLCILGLLFTLLYSRGWESFYRLGSHFGSSGGILDCGFGPLNSAT